MEWEVAWFIAGLMVGINLGLLLDRWIQYKERKK